MANISDILINEEIVRKKLNKLKEDKAMGPDGIHRGSCSFNSKDRQS